MSDYQESMTFHRRQLQKLKRNVPTDIILRHSQHIYPTTHLPSPEANTSQAVKIWLKNQCLATPLPSPTAHCNPLFSPRDRGTLLLPSLTAGDRANRHKLEELLLTLDANQDRRAAHRVLSQSDVPRPVALCCIFYSYIRYFFLLLKNESLINTILYANAHINLTVKKRFYLIFCYSFFVVYPLYYLYTYFILRKIYQHSNSFFL